MAESKRGKLGKEKRFNENTPTNAKGGKDFNIELKENLKFNEGTATTQTGPVGGGKGGKQVIKTTTTASGPGGTFRVSNTQIQKRRKPRQITPKSSNPTPRTGLKFNDSIELFLTRGQPKQKLKKTENTSLSFKDEIQVTKETKPKLFINSAGFLAGAKATARLRSQSEEERRKEPPLVQASQGFAEGVGQTAFAVGSVPIAFGMDVKGLIEGKQFGEGSKDFVDAVQKEFRPSTLSQGLSQLNPDVSQRQAPQFDITGISRSVGEVAPFAGFARGTRVPVPARQQTLQRTSGRFTRDTIPLGEGQVFKEGPAFNPVTPQSIAKINLGEGIGKTKLRDTPRKNPFLEDNANRLSGRNVFGSNKESLGVGAVRTITRENTQAQNTGLKTIVRQTQQNVKKQKSDIDILRQKPRFSETRIRAGEAPAEFIRFPKGKSVRGSLGLAAFGPAAATAIRPKQDRIPISTVIPKSLTKTGTRQRTGIRQSTIPKGGLKFRDDTSFKLIQGPKLTPPFKQITTQINPPIPPTPPRLPPVRVPVGPPFPAGNPARFDSFIFSGARSSRPVFTAFGISENINIKNLPTFQRVGRSSKVFTQLDKEDKAIQKAIFGKQTKRKSKKTSKRKKKR
jgi:hypothetical protein